MKSSKNVILTVFMILLVSTSLFATNGTYLNGFSAYTLGRGGVSYGFYDSPTLMMNNPAAIGLMNGSMLEVNFSLLMPKLHFSNALNDKDSESNSYPLVDLAYASRLNQSNWSWGFGVFTQGGMGSTFKLKHALFPEEKEYHSQFGALEVGPSIAYQANDRVSIGASAHLLYGMMDMWMPYSLSPGIMVGQAMPGLTFGQLFGAPMTSGGLGYSEVTAYAEMKDLAGFGYNFNVSMQYKLTDQLTVGAGFTSKSTLKLRNGKATMDMTDQFNDAFNKMVMGALVQMGIDPASATPQQLQAAQQGVQQQLGQMGIDPGQGMLGNYDVQTDLGLPAKVGFGFSYRASEALTIGGDVEYIAWSSAFDKMPLKFTNGSNANINKMLGASDLALDFPLNWNDTYVFKLGAELRVSPFLTARAGFVHGQNPVPNETLFPVFPAIVENHVNFGFTANVSERIAVNGSYQLALNKKQNTDQSILAQEYVNSTSELMEHLFNISLMIKF